MSQSWNVTKAAMFCLVAGLASAQTVSLTVNTGNVLHAIDPKIYGQSLESANGGLWGEAVWNRSFEDTLNWGAWRVNDGVLEAAGGNDESRFDFGAETWRDYELTVDVMRPAGSGVLSVGVRRDFLIENFALSLGGAGGFELARTVHNPAYRAPKTTVLQTAAGQIENGRWYKVRIRINGTRLQAWLDGKVLCDVSAADGPANGRAFVSVSGSGASFAHLSVTSIGGEPLFDGVPTAARHWFAVGPGEIAVDTSAPFNGKQSLRIVSRDAESGIEQRGFAVRAGDALRGSLWLAGTGPGVVVRLVDGGQVLAEQAVGAPGAEWQEFPLLLNPAATSGNATLRIVARAGSAVKLDQVSLMPDSYRANGGFRSDLTHALAALHPPIIRWPGRFVQGYKWKDGIGPQAKRLDTLAFGLDEFLIFARKVGAEPVLVIPAGSRIAVERAPFVQDAVDLVEYCNGPRDSGWGRIRARNGHPQPYGVKYWELDHNLSNMTAAEYVEALGQFFPAMKKVDRTIRTISDDYLAQVPDVAHLVDYLSIEHYDQSGRLAHEIAQSKNPKLKLFVSGWNSRSADWRGGLEAGEVLNTMEGNAAAGMAAPAQLLQHISADFPDNALIHFDQRSWFPSPDYVVTRLYRDHFAPDLLQIGGDLAGLSATATRAADGETIYLKLVNPADREVAVEVTLRGDFPLLAASMQLVAPDSLDARNTLEKPTAVQVVEGKVERAGMSARFSVPRWSVAVVTLSR
jgi:alpha-N-arabinofuranosidase